MIPTGAANSPVARRQRRWLDCARSGSSVAAFFCVVVGVVLLINHFLVPSSDPLKSISLAQVKEKLRANPTDEALKQSVRALDLQARRTYFRHLNLNLVGAWLLVIGAGLFVLTTRNVRAAAETPHLPKAQLEEAVRHARAAMIGRWAIAGSGAVLLLTMLALSAGSKSRLPATARELVKLQAGDAGTMKPHVAAFLAGRMQNWPMFRGPLGTGIAFTTNAPLTWNVTNSEGIVWKSPVPAKGHSSPIVWGERVFLTGGEAKAREVMCFDANTGALLWQKPVPPPAGLPADLEVPEDTGYAASTPATDGTRVFAIFATGELAALDFAGNVVWSKHLGVLDNMYGHSSSLLLWQDRLIVLVDQGEPDAGKSRLYAFDTATGRELWQQRRAVGSSWSTPIVIEQTNKTQIITLAEPWVIAYDATQGTELWRADCIGTDIAPTPVFGSGLLLLASPNNHLAAVRVDGQGDVTSTNIVWRESDIVPDITSPVTDGKLLFVVSTSGLLGCVDAQTGKLIWEHELDQDVNASPTLVGDKLYIISLKGESFVIEAGREFKELARGHLGEIVHASPAFVGKHVFVRGTKSLFCLGEKK